MALKYEPNFKNSVKINGKDIFFRPWNTKDEKDYLIAVDENSNITDDDLFRILIRPCLADPDLNLSVLEKKVLIIEIRKKSLGSTFQINFKCPSCSSMNESVLDLNDVVQVKDDSFSEVTFDNIRVKFGFPRSAKLMDRIKGAENAIEKNFLDMLVHIEEIYIDNEKETGYSFEEMQEFFNSLPANMFDYFYEKYLEMKGSINFHTKVQCMKCQEITEMDLDGIPNFLWV